ncbi:MAG: tripartite tricarboxylate transporter substrate binding protein [Alphaproteobacteria bacterium]|nr:tripartite tricarboxylate transporter substrate binding protein [Alphaproteobacteria bacterium]
MKRRNALALLGSAPLALRSGTTRAQDSYPNRPVRLVVPFGPGGSGDIVSRIVAHELEKMAGQPFIVDNKPGATAMIGTAIVKNAPADGYTLLHGSTSSLAANPALYKQLTYDPDDFTTVAVDGTIPGFMLVAKDAPYNSVKEFVAWARTRKEPIFSGFGNTSSRVPSALFAEQSGVQFEEVAYKDAVPAIQDLIGGRIQVTFPDIVIGETYVRSGQVKALAVTSPQRAPQYPDLEAIAETYAGFEAIAFLSFSVRKEVPVEIQRKLAGWVMEALYKPEVYKRLLQIGITPPPRDWDIAKSDAFVKRERELWTRYIKLAKIEPQ